MNIPGPGSDSPETRSFVAAEDVGRYGDEAAAQLEEVVGIQWYERPGSQVDRVAVSLCRLRRARAGERGGPSYGDEAVRAVLGEASPQAVVWLASRAISYMDESGFPEVVEPWLE